MSVLYRLPKNKEENVSYFCQSEIMAKKKKSLSGKNKTSNCSPLVIED